MKSDPRVASHKDFLGERNLQTFSVYIAWVRFAGAENLLFQSGGCNSKGEQISSECEEFIDI